MSNTSYHLGHWSNLICELSSTGHAIALGLFSAEGKLLFANGPMCYYLNTTETELQPQNLFVNPKFESFLQGEGLVFEGYTTIGNYADSSFVLLAKVYRQADQIFVFAEPNVPELFENNLKLSELNQQVNNLQRQLIKEKKTLEQTLNMLKETQQMLIHSEKMNALGKLVAGVAHEVNNPIAFVYSNLHTMGNYFDDVFNAYLQLEQLVTQTCDGKLSEQARQIRTNADLDFLKEDIDEMLGETKNGVNRVKTIVDDLRRFSRLDEAESKTIDLIENLRSTIAIIRVQMEPKKIRFNFEAPEKLVVNCYPGQLNQAILNILINAIQAAPFQGEVNLKVSSDNDQVYIVVEDNGPGIPAEIQNRIFDPFFTTKPVGSGTGLGLSITFKIIVELHKGSISVNSEPGKRTSFLVSIPLKK
jgi:signal transduction histidine kinase